VKQRHMGEERALLDESSLKICMVEIYASNNRVSRSIHLILRICTKERSKLFFGKRSKQSKLGFLAKYRSRVSLDSWIDPNLQSKKTWIGSREFTILFDLSRVSLDSWKSAIKIGDF
jgi:hypothetical protein